jgi:hypothetical protein
LLLNQREAVRDKYIQVTKDRQNNITTLRDNLKINNKLTKESYELKYDAEMKSISYHEGELQKLMDIRARHMKESIERKLEISQARVTMERKTNAQNIKQEDL